MGTPTSGDMEWGAADTVEHRRHSDTGGSPSVVFPAGVMQRENGKEEGGETLPDMLIDQGTSMGKPTCV